MSKSLQSHGLQHTRLLFPSPTLRACSNSYLSSQWCHPTISSSVAPFYSCRCPLIFLPSIFSSLRVFSRGPYKPRSLALQVDSLPTEPTAFDQFAWPIYRDMLRFVTLSIYTLIHFYLTNMFKYCNGLHVFSPKSICWRPHPAVWWC